MKYFILFVLSLSIQVIDAQAPNECKLSFGTNLGGLADYTTELPFVNLMHNARQWYTKGIDNPADPFDSGHASNLSYREDGYPTHAPQVIEQSEYKQKVVTIWAITDGWPSGEYTVLWEGNGTLSFWGSHTNLQETNDHRITFDYETIIDGVIEMTIAYSDINDPIHNIRILMPGTEHTYESQPFYNLWLEKLSIFSSVRFMDWGATNNWGQEEDKPWDNPVLFSWAERAQMNNYTWANGKGIPYEMMIKLMNQQAIDGWVCVPHRANDEYIQKMAELFRDKLDDDRHLTVEYSNEIWNWLFAQTQWLNSNGCEKQGKIWPEGIVPYVQNCLDIWSDAYANQLDRITRVAGVQASWQDVSNRMVNNMREGSFDGVSPTFYFGFTDDGDEALDALGAEATVEDIAFYARQGLDAAKASLVSQKNELADPLGLPLVFYEGGQHLTGHPFGTNPSYADALLQIQRDTSMYNLYNEWFDFLETLQEGDSPIQLMNFSFIANLSSQFGSWGILETLAQDTNLIPAPKYSAILNRMNNCNTSTAITDFKNKEFSINLYPNPNNGYFFLSGDFDNCTIEIMNSSSQVIKSISNVNSKDIQIDISSYNNGLYFLKITNEANEPELLKMIKTK